MADDEVDKEGEMKKTVEETVDTTPEFVFKHSVNHRRGFRKVILTHAAGASGPDMDWINTLITAASKLPYDTYAPFQLGYFYREGIVVKRDYAKARHWFKKAAEMGSGEAQYELGILLDKGLGGKQSYKKAGIWWAQAAELGNANAQYELGLLRYTGTGVKQSVKTAVALWQEAAANGSAAACKQLYLLYGTGEGVKKDMKKSRAWMEQAAVLGDEDAITYVRKLDGIREYNLGEKYREGKDVQQSYSRAALHYKKAADLQNADAQCNLGVLYTNGLGVKRSFETARKWLTEADMQGSKAANEALAGLREEEADFEFNKGIKCEKRENYKTAAEHYQKAATLGDKGAQYNLGVLYANGQGVDEDMGTAVRWWRESAKQENQNAIKVLADLQEEAVSEYNKGVSYEKKKNYETAAAHYREAADLGHADAQYSLAVLYANAGSLPEAFKLFTDAAAQGHQKAEAMLEAWNDEQAAPSTGETTTTTSTRLTFRF